MQLARCSQCGRLTAWSAIRCSQCGSNQLDSVARPGIGLVAAATTTETASFAMVSLDGGVRVLAIGPVGQKVRIDDVVHVAQETDGTFSLVSPVDA